MRHATVASSALAVLLATSLSAAPSAAWAGPPASPANSGPYSVELIDEHGTVLPTFWQGGRTYVLGVRGQRYLVRVRNGSARRAEVVVSVDGRDVLDGEPSALGKRGYLVDAWGEATIDGFRLSGASVAAFRFSAVSRSYAAQRGDARDVGVIGVAVFPERTPPPLARPQPQPWWRGGSGGRWDAEREELAPKEREAAPPEAAPEARAQAPGASSDQASAPALREKNGSKRPGLGTEFGESHESWVREVPFERASARPQVVLSLRYDDRRGLLALGIDVDGQDTVSDARLRESADPFRRDGRYALPPPGWRP